MARVSHRNRCVGDCKDFFFFFNVLRMIQVQSQMVTGRTEAELDCSKYVYCPVPFSSFNFKILCLRNQQMNSQLGRSVTISKPQEWLIAYSIQKRKRGLDQVSEIAGYFQLRGFPHKWKTRMMLSWSLTLNSRRRHHIPVHCLQKYLQQGHSFCGPLNTGGSP